MAETRFTVRVANTLTGAANYRGTFTSQADAETYAATEASRSRKFIWFEVWTGTPRDPRAPIKGTKISGVH